MLSTRKNRIASSCAALSLCFPLLALGLAPHAGLAQDAAHKKSAQASEPSVEPFFYQELTRESLGDIKNLDAENVPEGRVAPDGHIIVTGTSEEGNTTDVYVKPGKFVELLPTINIPGFTPVSVRVFDEGTKEALYGYGLENAGDPPILRIDAPPRGVNVKRVRVVAYDGQGKWRVVMRCILHTRIPNDSVADLDLKRNKEQCSLNITDNQTLTARHLYLGDICLGRMTDKTGKIDVDERRLAPGKYTCQLIAKNEDGILLPGPSSSFVVPARYDITPTNTDSKIVIPETNLDATLEVSVAHKPDLDIVKTRVYCAGLFMGEKEGDNFKIALPMRNVPDGKNSIEVIGIASDGVAYPVENIVVDLDNGAWRSRIQSTAEWQKIQENKAQIKKLNEDMQYWLKQGEFEPVTRLTKTVYTLRSITDHFAAGKKGEYMGKAARCMTQMADLQFESGNLYRKLNMLVPAKNMFFTVKRELLGSTDLTGEKAQKEYISLCKMQ